MNPLEQAGMPIHDQFRSWSDLQAAPYDPYEVDPYTRTRVILMNGIEVESVLFSHQFHRHTDNREIREQLAMARRVDQQQQKVVNGLNPGDQTPLETTIGYEQVAVDLTAWLARHERDPAVKMALDFALLEDFDHLYRYANLYELMDGRHAAELTGSLTEVTPGRPTAFHHRDPRDTPKGHVDTHTVHPLTRMHVMTIVAAEQQTMNFYMNHGADWVEPIARSLYAEIAQVEEEHVTHYGSLLDPLDSWLEQLVFHEYNEVYMYWSMVRTETDERIKRIWELHLEMELGQLQAACRLLEKYDGVDPAAILPDELPDTPVTFEPNKQYVRDVLAATVDLRPDGLGYTPADELGDGHRFFEYQDIVHAGGTPSEQVIEQNRTANGREYRDETEGDHPIFPLEAEGAAR